MVPLALFQSLFRELSQTTPLTSAGCDLEQILRGVDHWLKISNVSVVARAGDVSTQGQYARVKGYDADTLLDPLPSVLGVPHLVDGVNDTEVNVGKTNEVLVSAGRAFITLELCKREVHAGATVVKSLDTLTDQERLDLLPWETQSRLITFRTGQYLIARTVANLVDRVISALPKGNSSAHLVGVRRRIRNITTAYNAPCGKTPAMEGTDPALVGQTGFAFHVVGVGCLAMQTLMYQLQKGKELITGALGSASYLMMGDVKATDTPGDLVEKVLEGVLRGVELGGKRGKRDVSKKVCKQVMGQLQLLQVTHSLSMESLSLLENLEKHDEKAEDRSRDKPEVLKQRLAAWEVAKEKAADTVRGIDNVSETGTDVFGEHGSLALIQSMLSVHTRPPPSVAVVLPEPELLNVNTTDPGGSTDANEARARLRDGVQVLDTIRHLSKVWGESLAFCSILMRTTLQSVDTFADETDDELGQVVLSRLSEMNNVALTVAPLNSDKTPPSSSEVIKQMVEVMGQTSSPSSQTMSAQPGLFALLSTTSRPGGNRDELRALLAGTPSRLEGVNCPQLPFGELKEVALRNGWGTLRADSTKYVEFKKTAPYSVSDMKFKELGVREKAAYLMIFLDQMEKLFPEAYRQYVNMLDLYKSAVIKDRESRKKADTVLRKNGHVSMLANSVAQDYDELPGDLGDGARVAHLSVTLEEMRGQLKGVKDAAAVEAEATASRVKKEKEDKLVEDIGRDFLMHVFSEKGATPASTEDQEELLAGYMKSRVGTRGSVA